MVWAIGVVGEFIWAGVIDMRIFHEREAWHMTIYKDTV
jgi:hypothetical protein